LNYVFVESYFKPKEGGHVNAYAVDHEIHVENGFIELQDKKKHYNFDGIFDKDLLRLKNE
jgi:hypothetical protein